MKSPSLAESNLFAYKVNIELNMLRPAMMNGVGGEIYGRNVVTVDNRGMGHIVMQLLKKLSKPGALGNSVRHGAVLSLRARARHCRLSFRRARDEGWTEVDAIAGSTAPSVGAASPISIRIGHCRWIRLTVKIQDYVRVGIIDMG